MTSVLPDLSELMMTPQFAKAEERLRVASKVLTTKALIAQTPKQLIWALNKAKLYRYIPVVPEEQRHPVPLLLVFALMNRPYILDLRPGHSFVEFMGAKGYDVYLLDWGSPGLEDKTSQVRRLRAGLSAPGHPENENVFPAVKEFSMLGWCSAPF